MPHRSQSAPASSLHHAMMAMAQHMDSREPYPWSSQRFPDDHAQTPSTSKILVSAPYCAAVHALPNPRDPRPIASLIFPALAPDYPLTVPDDCLRQPLTVAEGSAFIASLAAAQKQQQARADVASLELDLGASVDAASQHKGVFRDPRTSLAERAYSAVKSATASEGGSSPHRSDGGRATSSLPSPCAASGSSSASTGAAPVVVNKYTQQADREMAAFWEKKYLEERAAREELKQKWDDERAKLQRDLSASQEKLEMSTQQLKMLNENIKLSLERCAQLETENTTNRQDFQQSVDRYKEMYAKVRQERDNQVRLNSDLQGRLDLYHGKTSVPLLPIHPDVERLSSIVESLKAKYTAVCEENETLQEENKKYLTRLAQVARELAELKK